MATHVGLNFAILFIFVSTCQQLATGNEESLGRQQHKADLGIQETEVLSVIAEGEKIGRDDGEEGSLKGALDEVEDDEHHGHGDEDDDDEDDYDEDFKNHDKQDGNYYIGMDSFLIQKLHNHSNDGIIKPPSTTYHTFEDRTFRTPLFTRSAEEHNVDFIIFASPLFPSGTGHYVVLRRLAAPHEPANYEMDDEFSAEDEDEYENEIKKDDNDDDNENDNGQDDEDVDDTAGNPNTEVPPGQIQSGEENYADNIEIIGPEGESVDTGGGGANDDEYENAEGVEPRLPFNLKIKYEGATVAKHVDADEDPTGETEVMYEAFSINFKESLHGFISDIDPLQYSFMTNNEDALTAMMDDENDSENPVGEGDDDSDSNEEDEELDGPPQTNQLDDDDKDLDSDKDFMEFQNTVKNDAGMMNTGGKDKDDTENDNPMKKPASMKYFNLPEAPHRKKRAAIQPKRKNVVISRIKKPTENAIQWKGCLRSVNVHKPF